MTEISTKKSTLRHVCLDGHANSFALNKDNNSIAVAGRSLLKIYTIEANSFNEVHNMRKQPNLSFSSNAIAWSHIDNINNLRKKPSSTRPMTSNDAAIISSAEEALAFAAQLMKN